jgi:hypothetical protein
MYKAIGDRTMKMCKYIFEGKVISRKAIRIRTDKDDYEDANSYIIQVQQVIKGDITIGTIGIIQYIVGNVYDKEGNIIASIQVKDGERNDFPNEGLYFSFKKVSATDTNTANTNSITLEFDGGVPAANYIIKKDTNNRIK